jgi:hypothetical protein
VENLFGQRLSAYPSGWTATSSTSEDIDLGGYVEVNSGPYAELHGVVTYLERDYAWVRLDGDPFDLRFRREILRRIE